MAINVLDISYAQGTINFSALKQSGIKDVIIRNGYYGKTDTCFDFNMQNAIANGFNIGTYTYIMSLNAQQAEIEARETVARLEKYKGHVNYPIFCDIEDNIFLSPCARNNQKTYTKRERTDIVISFCETVRKLGYYPALYINPAWLENYVYKEELLDKYDIWLAAWTNNPSKATRYNYGQVMWQWGTAKVNGINGVVDANLCYVDFPAQVKRQNMNYLVQLKPDTITKCQKIYKSNSKAAIRNGTSKESSMLGRVTSGDYYIADEIITKADGTKWIRHTATQSYSMLEDGGKLFTAVGNYEKYTAAAKVNLRGEAGLNGSKVGVLNVGEFIYVFKDSGVKKDNYTWYKAVYNGKIVYVASRFIKAVSV